MQRVSYEDKWRKTINMGYGRYVLFTVPIIRMILPLVLLFLINDIIFHSQSYGTNHLIKTMAVRLVLGYMIGVILASFNWQFRNRIISHKYQHLSSIRNRYIFIHGIIYVGFIFLINDINVPFNLDADTLVPLMLNLLLGIPFALGSWAVDRYEVVKFVR